jgi:hypothetical protein
VAHLLARSGPNSASPADARRLPCGAQLLKVDAAFEHEREWARRPRNEIAASWGDRGGRKKQAEEQGRSYGLPFLNEHKRIGVNRAAKQKL